MARLNQIPPYTGTRNGVCVYFSRGKYFIRGKSSLTSIRVKNAPEFAGTRKSAALLAQASRIGSAVYKTIPEKDRTHLKYRAITGEAFRLLKVGMTEVSVSIANINLIILSVSFKSQIDNWIITA